MTTTSRNSFWPKRWLRSFAGAALATAVVGGAVWAAEPQAKDAPKTSPTPLEPKAEPAKKEAPPAKKERLITFTMSDKPWKDVMAWYANETGLAFNSETKPPDGTFAFTAPKDPRTGEPKKFTIAELTDFLNETLLAKGFVLIRGESTFRLWPASDKIDPVLVRRVPPEELKTLASKDMVQVVFPLKTLAAADLVSDIQKVMSKVGEVSVLPGQNALLMIDFAGNLRQIVADLKAGEEGENPSEQLAHKCEWVKARDAATALEKLLGVEDTGDGRDGGRGRGFGGPGGFDPRMMQGGFDPRMMGGGGGPGFDPTQFTGGGGGQGRGRFGARTQKPTRVVSDDATNTVFVTGSADNVGKAKSFLTKFDAQTVGGEKIVPGKAEFQTYAVPSGNAEAFAQALQDHYRGTSVRIKALSGNSIVVYASPADQFDII